MQEDSSVRDKSAGQTWEPVSQRLQYPSIKDYTLSSIRVPSMIQVYSVVNGYWSLWVHMVSVEKFTKLCSLCGYYQSWRRRVPASLAAQHSPSMSCRHLRPKAGCTAVSLSTFCTVGQHCSRSHCHSSRGLGAGRECALTLRSFPLPGYSQRRIC